MNSRRNMVLGLLFDPSGKGILVRQYAAADHPHGERLTGLLGEPPNGPFTTLEDCRVALAFVCRREAGVELPADACYLGMVLDGWGDSWAMHLLAARVRVHTMRPGRNGVQLPVADLLLGRHGPIVTNLHYLIPMAQAALRGEIIQVSIKDLSS